jgi:hypothetical protein
MSPGNGAGSLGGGLGGSVSGLRPPGADAPTGLGARPLPALSGMGGVTPGLDEPVGEAPTIPLRRPNRPEPAPEPAPVPAAAPAPPKPTVQLAGWLPSDDDILPSGQLKKRKSFRLK